MRYEVLVLVFAIDLITVYAYYAHRSTNCIHFHLISQRVVTSLPSVPAPQSSNNENTIIPVGPSTQELLQFGLPTLGVWFLQPVLSLIDSAVIGRSHSLESVLELAALGPGIAWIDSTSYAFQFMGMATTILLNKAFITRDDDAIARSLSHSIFTSLVFGCLLGCLQYTFARPAVRALAGSSLEIIPFALVYSRIRSFAAVFALPTIVIQSAYLTWKDAKTPLEAVLFGALFNLVGDVLLVSVYKMGITGAAIATLLSQIAGFLYLVFIGIQRISSAKQRPIHDTTYYRTLIKVPTPAESLGFISFAGPLFFILIIKTLLWTFTTYASSKSGAFQLAAHQLILNFFLLFCIFGDVISQLSQTFLPPYLQRYMKIIETKDINTISSHDSPDLFTPLKATIRRIFSIALVVGSTNTLLSIILSRFTPQFFTRSSEIILAIKDISVYLVLCVFPNCLMAAMEGIIIASEDFKFHTSFYLVLGSVFLTFMNVARNAGFGIKGVWLGMVAYQWVRLLGFSYRVNSNLFNSRSKFS